MRCLTADSQTLPRLHALRHPSSSCRGECSSLDRWPVLGEGDMLRVVLSYSSLGEMVPEWIHRHGLDAGAPACVSSPAVVHQNPPSALHDQA